MPSFKFSQTIISFLQHSINFLKLFIIFLPAITSHPIPTQFSLPTTLLLLLQLQSAITTLSPHLLLTPTPRLQILQTHHIIRKSMESIIIIIIICICILLILVGIVINNIIIRDILVLHLQLKSFVFINKNFDLLILRNSQLHLFLLFNKHQFLKTLHFLLKFFKLFLIFILQILILPTQTLQILLQFSNFLYKKFKNITKKPKFRLFLPNFSNEYHTPSKKVP